jgi:hypothetical protein
MLVTWPAACRGTGRTLAERSGAGPAAEQRVAGRPCWVIDAPGYPGRFPGIVLEWRRAGDAWEARVAYAMDDARAARLVERSIANTHLHPA